MILRSLNDDSLALIFLKYLTWKLNIMVESFDNFDIMRLF